MNKIKDKLYKIWSKFLIIFGEIKIVKWFPWIQYDPIEYKVTGNQILQIAELLKPGDVLLRRYDGYIDNWFIDGKYSHSGLYIGENKIIHAINPTISEIDLIDFCRCDGICVLRPKSYKKNAIKKAKKYLSDNIPYDFGYNKGDDALYCFEMCAECYDKFDLPKYKVKYLLGLIRREAYLGKSFLESDKFKNVYEF